VCAVLCHAFGRVGCFLGGCCYGRETNSIFGIYYPMPHINGAIEVSTKVFPVQIYESLFLFALFALVYKKTNNAIVKYFFGYGIFRFGIEFLRGDDRGLTVLISPSQWISLLLILSAIIILFFTWKKSKTEILH